MSLVLNRNEIVEGKVLSENVYVPEMATVAVKQPHKIRCSVPLRAKVDLAIILVLLL